MASDGPVGRTRVPAEDLEAGHLVYYSMSEETYRVGKTLVDDESGFTYIVLLDPETGDYENLDHMKPGSEPPVWTRSLDGEEEDDA